MPHGPDRRTRLRMDPDERRALILGAARRAFAERPYDEVSLTEIAREARASEALVHKYFTNKALFYGRTLALDAEELADRTRLADEALLPSATARDRIRTSIGVYLDFVAERAPGWAAHQMLAGHEPSDAARVRRRAREVSVDALRGLFGDADDARTTFTLWGYLGFLDSACLEWVAQGCPEDARSDLTEAALGCLAGALPGGLRVGSGLSRIPAHPGPGSLEP